VEDRILEILAELKRIADRRHALLAELDRLSASPDIASRRRRLIAEVLNTAPEQTTLFELPRSYNLMKEVRTLLEYNPDREFAASHLKDELQIPASAEKSFYAALAKLVGRGEIHRVGRALYKAARPKKSAPKKR
jgi:hypothetical protein